MSAEPKLSRFALASRTVLLVLITASMVATVTAGTWSFDSTGAMGGPHASGSAVLLNDGNVLVFGDDTGAPSEVYDSAVGSFSPISSLGVVRAGAAGERLGDGRVLIAGGENGSTALDTAEIFDPASRTLTTLGTHMSVGRVHPMVTQLIGGRILVAGGNNGATLEASAEVFDPSAGTFTATGAMAAPRLGSMTLLRDGRVLVSGGETADGGSTDVAELFDPSVNEFIPATGGMVHARRGHQATLLPDGRVLVTGGYGSDGVPIAQAEAFDPIAGLFQNAGSMISARADHRAVPLLDGGVLVIGGHNLAGVDGTAEIYDTATGLFTSAGAMVEARWSPAAAALADGRVLVAGGRDGAAAALATAELYAVDTRPAPKSDTSTTLTSSAAGSTYGLPVTYTAWVTSSGGTPGGEVKFVDNATRVLATASIDAAGTARATVTSTPAGTRSITAEYGGSEQFNASTSAPVSQSVTQADATATMTESPLQRQYSDRVILDAVVSPATAAKSVTFTIGNQSLGTVLLVNGKAHLEPQLLGAVQGGVKLVFARFNQDEPDYEIYDPYRSMTVMREDARVAFTAPTTINTGCSTCSTATVTLEATVSDISLISPATDSDPGDVSMATVAFVNRATGLVIQTVPVTADPKDHRVGKAVYQWPVNIGRNSSQTFTIGMLVGNQYVRGTTADDAKVTVVKR